jgi:PAS domain S-box-containing protein
MTNMSYQQQSTETEYLYQRIAELERIVEQQQAELAHIRQQAAHLSSTPNTPPKPHLLDAWVYQTIFDQIPVPIVIYALDGTLVAINAANEHLINTPAETLTGIFNMYEDQEAIDKGYVEHFNRCRAGEHTRMSPTSYTTTYAGLHQRRDDRTISTETSYVPIRDQQGNVWYIAEINVDVAEREKAQEALRKAYDSLETRVQQRTIELTKTNTQLQAEVAERKHIEEVLRINEERYERAIQAANVGVWDWNLLTNELYLAPNLKALLGYADDEIANHLDAWGSLVHPDDQDIVMQAAQAHIKGETPLYEAEHRMLHKDGNIRWFLVRGIVICDERGVPVRMSGTDSDITERKHMEEALRQSEERYRIISELISDYAYAMRVEPDGSFSYEWVISEAFKRTTGYTQEEVMQRGGPSSILFHEDVPAMRIHRQRLLKGQANTYEFRIVTKDGLTRWLCDHGQPVWDEEQQRVVRIYGAIEDVTERRKAEVALRESEERYRSIITTMHEGVVLQDKEGAICEWNARAKSMLGRTTEKLLGQTSIDSNWHAIREDGTPFAGLNHPSMVALRTGRPCSNVVMGMYKPDGSLTWMLVNAQPMFCDSSPAPCRVVTTFTDITELKQAQQELEKATTELGRNRDLLDTLFNGLTDGLVLLDSQTHVLAINQAVASIMGEELSQLMNRSWMELSQETPSPFPVELVTQTLEDGMVHRRRERYDGADAHAPRVLDIQTLPIVGQHNTIDQVVVHMVDVTEQLTLEAAAIQHERLAASGALAATVAHEINTPLQSINHCLFLAYDLTDPQRDSYLTMAREEIARISQIVRQLLDLHRPTSTNPAHFQVNPIVERVLTLTNRTLARQQIIIEKELAAWLPPLWGHSDQMNQVIFNLILNAKKAMPEGGVLRVRTVLVEDATTIPPCLDNTAQHAPEQPSRAIIIQVEDTGTGISPTIRSRIFDSFFTTSTSGSGLGLTISKKIVVQHGGYITVQSTPEQGSTFSIVFPLTQQHSEHLAPNQ